MRAEARLEIDDETARAEAERYLEDLAVTIADFPSVHAADTWHNLGVARFRRGATEAARECWTRAVALNPGLDTAADLLERTATLGTPR
jgi:Tfp pilus assembly protein PilF